MGTTANFYKWKFVVKLSPHFALQRKHSIATTVVNIVIGFVVALVARMLQ